MTPAERLAKRRKKTPHRAGVVKAVLKCRLRECREPLGLTLRDVADETGASMANLSRLERGGQVELSTAFKLAAFFGKTVQEIWEPL